MLNCKDMTKLISDSLERRISFRERMELWFHVMMCGMCRRFRSNIIQLRKFIRDSKAEMETVDAPSSPMPPEMKSRLEESVNRQLG